MLCRSLSIIFQVLDVKSLKYLEAAFIMGYKQSGIRISIVISKGYCYSFFILK